MLSLREYATSAIVCCHLVLIILFLVFSVLFSIVYVDVIDCHGAIWPLNIAFWAGVGGVGAVTLVIETAYWVLLGGTLHDRKHHSGDIAAWTTRLSVALSTAFAVVMLATDLASGSHSSHLITHQQAYHTAALVCCINAVVLTVGLYCQLQTDNLPLYILPKIIVQQVNATYRNSVRDRRR